MNFSLNDIITSRNNFKKCVIGNYEDPSALIFKPFFYFAQGSSEYTGISTGGLLGDSRTADGEYNNSATGYLARIQELIRYKYLRQFQMLLSYLNLYMPWYFHSISGLNEALSRDFNEIVKNERKKITITCLEDAVDLKVNTLLNLYRNACFSWENKKEIVPANLRKFDMGIFIVNVPLIGKQLGMTLNGKDESGMLTQEVIPAKNIYDMASNAYTLDNRASSIYLEFRNCEIDYNSGTEAYSEFSNEEMLSPKAQINIYYDDCYEVQFNEFMSLETSDLLNRFLTNQGLYEFYGMNDQSKYNIKYSELMSEATEDRLKTEEENRQIALAQNKRNEKRNAILNGLSQYAGLDLEGEYNSVTGKFKDLESTANEYGLNTRGEDGKFKLSFDKQKVMKTLIGGMDDNLITSSAINPENSTISPYTYNIYGRIPYWQQARKGLLGNLAQSLVAEANIIGGAKSFINKLWLGNVHEASPADIFETVGGALGGNTGEIKRIAQKTDSKNGNLGKDNQFGNVYASTYRGLL